MKNLYLFLILINISIYVYSQSDTITYKPIFDDGYYFGLCETENIDDKYDKYLYVKFLSNDSDSIMIVAPYLMKKTINSEMLCNNRIIMNDIMNDYLTNLSVSASDIEYHEIENNEWSIEGFDNFTYYEIDKDIISFSLNIVSIETEEIEIFYFDGMISEDGEKINAVVYSDKNTFKESVVVLEYLQTSMSTETAYKK